MPLKLHRKGNAALQIYTMNVLESFCNTTQTYVGVARSWMNHSHDSQNFTRNIHSVKAPNLPKKSAIAHKNCVE